MKTRIKVLLFFILYACDDNNNVQCFSPPPGFTFEIVDKTNWRELIY